MKEEDKIFAEYTKNEIQFSGSKWFMLKNVPFYEYFCDEAPL